MGVGLVLWAGLRIELLKWIFSICPHHFRSKLNKQTASHTFPNFHPKGMIGNLKRGESKTAKSPVFSVVYISLSQNQFYRSFNGFFFFFETARVNQVHYVWLCHYLIKNLSHLCCVCITYTIHLSLFIIHVISSTDATCISLLYTHESTHHAFFFSSFLKIKTIRLKSKVLFAHRKMRYLLRFVVIQCRRTNYEYRFFFAAVVDCKFITSLGWKAAL